RFIVSRKAEGRIQGGQMGSELPVTDKLLQSIISNFIKLHNVRIDQNDPLVQQSHLREWTSFKTITDVTRYFVAEFIPKVIRLTDIAMTPQLLRALKWLERNLPRVDEPPLIVHLDFCFNNLIING